MLATEQAKPSEETGRQQSIAVFEYSAAANGTGLGVKGVVDEIHPSVVVEVGLVREPDRDGVLDVAGGRPRTGCRKPQITQEVCLGAVEDEMDGIDRHDHGQERCAGLAPGDEVPGIDATIGDAPGGRCTYLSPFKVELRLLISSCGSMSATVPIRSAGLNQILVTFVQQLLEAVDDEVGLLEIVDDILPCA